MDEDPLSRAERRCWDIYEKEGLNGKEIAKKLWLNSNTVYFHLRNAREKLGLVKPKGK